MKIKQILLILLSLFLLLGVTAFAEPDDPNYHPEAAPEDEHPLAWQKIDTGYINSLGDVIVGARKRGIDVSFWQGEIDWKAVKASDVDFAILRCGYGRDLEEQDDSKWFANADACTRLGIPFGVYLYSYATDIDGALSEAAHVIRLLSGYRPDYPVFYDLENADTMENCSNEEIGLIADAFCSLVAENGYDVGVYSGINWWNSKLTSRAFDHPSIYKWVANWAPKCKYEKPFAIWQSTETGHVPGIDGYVDIDFSFDDGIDHSKPYQSNILAFTVDKKEAYVFGKRKTNDVAPIIRNDRTMLPARFFAESLGAEVLWDSAAEKVTITKGDTEIILFANSDTAYLNNNPTVLDSPAFIENDRIYTPLRFIAENLDADIVWDESTNKVIVYKQ